MTMRFNPNTSLPSGDYGLRYLFAWLDFMRTASPGGPGWTVSRSSDGSTGGAGDNISDFLDLGQYAAGTSESWFVLRQPDGARELLFNRTNTFDQQWQLWVSETAAFTGGDAGNPPTAVDQKEIHTTINIVQSGANVLHMGADDAAPYGWWTWIHLSGNFSNHQGGMGMIPITDAVQPNDTLPVVYYHTAVGEGWVQAELTFGDGVTSNSQCQAWQPNTSNFETCAALLYQNSSGQIFPNNCSADDNGEDLAIPVVFARRSSLANSFLKGVSDFIMWNGITRAPGETFDSLARVSIGDVNVEWDGVTVPLVS